MDWETSFDEYLEHLCEAVGQCGKKCMPIEQGSPTRPIAASHQ